MKNPPGGRGRKAILICTKHLTLVFALVLAAAGESLAAPHRVTSLNDSGPGSLRQAILDLNASGGGEIHFARVAGTIRLLSELPSFVENIRILGPGTNVIIVSGEGQFRVFSMNAGTTNTISGLTIADGVATNGPGMNPPPSYASGISNGGNLKLIGCLVRNCAAEGPGYGGGIYNEGNLEMQDCVVLDCGWQPGHDSEWRVPGGGIYNSGTLAIKRCLISRCSSADESPGGGIYNDGRLAMADSALDSCSGASESDGGGLFNRAQATLSTCTVSNCGGFWGGGVLNWGGDLALTNCSLIDNSALVGGGLFVWGDGTVALSGCSIVGNSGDFGGSGINNVGNLRLLNCTISQNFGSFTYYGGGVIVNGRLWGQNYPTATLNMDHCTVAFNGGLGEIRTTANFSSANTILADCVGTLTSGGYNLIQNTDACTIIGDETGNIYGMDPLLGPLQDNGGPTWTHALLPASPAIDHAVAGGLDTDQRGFIRPFDVPGYTNTADGSDIGAFEWASHSPWISPVLVGRINDGGAANDVAVAGHRLYVAEGPQGVKLFDISDPASPRPVASTQPGGAAVQLALRGDELFVANSDDGLRIYEVCQPTHFIEIGHVDTPGFASAVAVQGNLALVADRPAGFELYRLTREGEPRLVGRSANPGNALAAVIRGSHAFVAAGNQGVWIYRIENPARPQLVGRIADAQSAAALALAGKYLYVANLLDGVRIYDITHPGRPQPAGHINTGGTASDVVVARDLAYVANGSDGLRIYDVSHPNRAFCVAQASDCTPAQTVTVAGRFAFVASGQAGVAIYYTGGPVPHLEPTRTAEGTRLVIHGMPGDQYRILASSDLRTWEPLAAVTNETGRIEVPDPAAKKSASRFYRAAMP
jgi:hypothetical protein